MRAKWKRRRRDEQREAEESVAAAAAVPLEETASGGRGSGVHRRGVRTTEEPQEEGDLQQPAMQSQVGIDMVSHAISVKAGIAIIIGFFGSPFPSLFLFPPLYLWTYNSQRTQ